MNSIKLIAGSSHPALVEAIARRLGTKVALVEGIRLPSSETAVVCGENLRDEDVFIVQTGQGNINELVMELMITVAACRKASARRITAVMPLFPYARQDRKDKGRAPITAKLMADMLQSAGVDHVVTLDLHAPQIQGFFTIPVDNLVAEPLIEAYINGHVDKSKAVVVSPDAGGAKRAADIADRLDLQLALIHKERQKANEVSNMVLVGVVKDRECILVDDMADTCGTLAKAADTLMQHGAKSVIAIVSHGIFSGNALQKITNSSLKTVVCTNSVPLSPEFEACDKVDTIDISATMAEAIRRLHNGESVSYLFRNVPSISHTNMSDDLRKDFTTKAKEAVTPNDAKSDGQKAKESVTNAADKVGSSAQPDTTKSLPQQAYDKVKEALN